MTYVIARKIGDETCIIADSLITIESSDGHVRYRFGLKLGILFEGCIFGVTYDDERPLIKFLALAQDHVQILKTAKEKWDGFCAFAKSYNSYPKERGFQIVLSSRRTGDPELYSLNSNKKVIEPENNEVTLGSGKLLIDGQIELLESPSSNFNLESLRKKYGLDPADYPYVYCAILNGQRFGPDAEKFVGFRVGGYYSFVRQTQNNESLQNSAIYVYVKSPEKASNIIKYQFCRTSYFENCLSVMFHNDKGEWHSLSANPMMTPDLFGVSGAIDTQRLEEIAKAAERACENEPYYILVGCDSNSRRPFPVLVIDMAEGHFDLETGPQGWFSEVAQAALLRTEEQANQLRNEVQLFFEYELRPAIKEWIANPSNKTKIEKAVEAHDNMITRFFKAYSESKELVFDANNIEVFRQRLVERWPAQERVILPFISFEPLEQRCSDNRDKLVAALKETIEDWEALLTNARDELGGELPEKG